MQQPLKRRGSLPSDKVKQATPSKIANRQKSASGAASAGKQTSVDRKVSSRRKSINRLSSVELNQISTLIPYRPTFLKFSGQLGSAAESGTSGLLRSIRKNVKGLFESNKTIGLDKQEITRLRSAVGDLKKMKADSEEPSEGKQKAPAKKEKPKPKTKRELLEERRKALGDQTKTPKKNPTVGMRIELERLKKKFPGDPNLSIMSAILTSKDTDSVNQSIDDRIRSLDAAVQEAGAVVLGNYLTTYSIDIFCDIYFLYLEVVKSKFISNLKTVGSKEIESLRRDIRVVDMLLEHKKLGKTIANIAKKLDGFGYPMEPLTASHVAKTFRAGSDEGDVKVGPGTVKLNKFLIRLYMNVFSQIPVLQPVARKYCEALPSNRLSRALIANVNVESAIIKFKLAKFNRSLELPKMIMVVYNYAKSFIGKNFAETVSSPIEARLLLRIAQMVEEMSLVISTVPPEMITYGYNCATIALHYYKNEAEGLITRISDIAARQRIELHQ